MRGVFPSWTRKGRVMLIRCQKCGDIITHNARFEGPLRRRRCRQALSFVPGNKGSIQSCGGRYKAIRGPKQERGVLLKDLSPEQIQIFADKAKEDGLVEKDVWALSRGELGYLRYWSGDQIDALNRALPHRPARRSPQPGWALARDPVGYTILFVYEYTAVIKVLKAAGVQRPEAYVRTVDSPTRMPITLLPKPLEETYEEGQSNQVLDSYE